VSRFYSIILKKEHLLLLFILLVALVLRFYKLETFPVGFHIDEAIIGDTAYSLLLTGKDYDGNFLPHSVQVFNDYIPAGYHYLTILPVKLFGLTEFSTRFIGALFGSLTVVSIYFFTQALFKRKVLSLMSSLLVAVAPWHIILSRSSSETLVSLFFILSGFACLFYSLEKKKYLLLFISILLLLFSFLIYHTPRIFVPLMFFATLCIYFWNQKKQKIYSYKFWIAGGILLSIFSFYLVFLLGGGTNRFNQTSIFSNPETQLILAEQIREDGVVGVPALVARIFHNKIVNYSQTFASNYLEYFTGDFLFFDGAKPNIFAIPNTGMMYLIHLPFLCIGLLTLITSKKKYSLLPIFWILLSPIVASLTFDDIPNIRRAVVLFPMLELVSAYGFLFCIEKVSRRFKIPVLVGSGVVLVYLVAYFLHQYFIHMQVHVTGERNNGFKILIHTIDTKFASYDRVIITKRKGGLWPLIVFHTKYDPRKYHDEGSPKDEEFNGFGKYYFVPDLCPSLNTNLQYPESKKVLFVDSGESCKILPEGKREEFIYRENGSKTFRLVY
jgi:4-amino-4-deoxy-L-arabinose transferase-like glycosyltransferase